MIELDVQMMTMLGLLGFTVFLFVSEVVTVDVAALMVLATLGFLTLVPGLEHLIDTRSLFSGFSSHAVMSIMAVMIIGAGLERSGIMNKIAQCILRYAGRTERNIMTFNAALAALLSAFMQNVGVAALFIPVCTRIARYTQISVSRLLMPMAFTPFWVAP